MAETPATSAITALPWERPEKIGAWIPETKVRSLSSLCFNGLSGDPTVRLQQKVKRDSWGKLRKAEMKKEAGDGMGRGTDRNKLGFRTGDNLYTSKQSGCIAQG